MSNKIEFPTYKDHLNKTYLEELNHKLWSTKGSRFNANKRLLTQNDLSNKAIGFLSSYLIIFGLLSVYQISSNTFLNENIIAFGSTTLSILLLAFSQMESAQDYKMRAHHFHECSLKIANLYNQLRAFKTLNNSNDVEKRDFCEKISRKYQKILASYPNHENIDFELFRAEHRDFYELGYFETIFIKIKFYFKTKFLYHTLIFGPLLTLIIYLLVNNIY